MEISLNASFVVSVGGAVDDEMVGHAHAAPRRLPGWQPDHLSAVTQFIARASMRTKAAW